VDGANVEEPGGDKESSPLYEASRLGREAVVRLLLKHGVAVSSTAKGGDTPLHVAALAGHLAVVAMLIDHGAEVSIKDNDGGSPLHGCVLQGHMEVHSKPAPLCISLQSHRRARTVFLMSGDVGRGQRGGGAGLSKQGGITIRAGRNAACAVTARCAAHLACASARFSSFGRKQGLLKKCSLC